MDKFDQKIIAALTRNARQSIAAIGDGIGLSRTAVNDRIKKLEQNGTIRGYTILRGLESQDCISAYFELRFRPFDVETVKAAISEISQIKQAHALTGDTDLMIYVEAESMAQLNEIRKQLSELDDLDLIQTRMGFECLL